MNQKRHVAWRVIVMKKKAIAPFSSLFLRTAFHKRYTMLCTDLFEILTSSISSRIVIFLFERTSLTTFCTFSSVSEVKGRPDRSSFLTNSFPLLNRSYILYFWPHLQEIIATAFCWVTYNKDFGRYPCPSGIIGTHRETRTRVLPRSPTRCPTGNVVRAHSRTRNCIACRFQSHSVQIRLITLVRQRLYVPCFVYKRRENR